jgi:hypothetical protein
MKRLVTVATLIALAACAGRSAGTPLPSQVAPSMRQATKGKTPPQCNGQSSTTEFAIGAPAKFASSASRACIPAFGGFGGWMEYPAARPSVGITATSSTTNYNKLLPEFGNKKPLLFLQFALTGPTTFGKTVRSGGGLTSKLLKPGTTYAFYGLGKATASGGVNQQVYPLTPCIETATAGPYGGVLSQMGTLLAAQKIAEQANITLEVYPAGTVTTKC